MAQRPGTIPGRFARWLRYTLRPPDVCFVHHPDYAHAAAGALLDPARADKILGFLTDEHLIRRADVSRPLPASLENVLRVHTAEYLESLADPEVVAGIMGMPFTPRASQDALDLMRLMVGGTIQATRMALRTGKSAVHLGGGFHHATPGEGMGFCVFNDVAVAIARLRAKGFDEPVLVVDLDLHDGNGTRAVFADDSTVHTFSIHNVAWDETEAVASTSIALGSDVTDEVFLDTLRRELPPVVEQHQPGLVIYVAGVDGAAGDALGDWDLSEEGMLERDRFVVSQVQQDGQSAPLAVVLAGGYGASAWRHSARFLGWLASGSVVEPPGAAEILVRQYREISKRWEAAGKKADEDDWGLSEEDITGLVTHVDTRFLGHFSKHQLELELQQLGFLDHVRSRGFGHPSITLEAPAGLGQTLRIYGDPSHTDLLLELKAGRSRSMVPGYEVIEIEWLLLQNPRGGFSEARPQLPGQSHPGLGLMRHVAAWLVVVCERLSLDGIAFVPSQYYMAAVGRRHLKFAEPASQARFEAMRNALAGVDLSDANRAVDGGRLEDARTGETVRWEPATMVVAVSGKLGAQLTGREYREAVRQALETYDFRLRADRVSD
jgi:acetoin utilization deacetylase AcuC-like enzyme